MQKEDNGGKSRNLFLRQIAERSLIGTIARRLFTSWLCNDAFRLSEYIQVLAAIRSERPWKNPDAFNAFNTLLNKGIIKR
jgi:hypothetical protein